MIVDGNSMGAAAAVFAGRELAHRVRGYILESPYQDLKCRLEPHRALVRPCSTWPPTRA